VTYHRSRTGLVRTYTGYSSSYRALVQGAVRGRRELLRWASVTAATGLTPDTWRHGIDDELAPGYWATYGDILGRLPADRVLTVGYRVR
jgi:hypothetical protein